MFDLCEPLDIICNDERVLVRRRAATLGDNTVVVDGLRIHRGFDEEFALSCNVQPVSGKELLQLPEGQRFDEQYWLFIDDSEQPTQASDLIWRPNDGCWYRAESCENWGSYTKIRMVLLDTGAWPHSEDDPLAEYDRQLFVLLRPQG